MNRGSKHQAVLPALAISFLAGLGACAGGGAPAPGQLSLPEQRITDEAFAVDYAQFDTWSRRLNTMRADADSAELYHHAKAGALLEMSREEYGDNDHSGIVESSFDEATKLIRKLESGSSDLSMGPPVVQGTHRVRPDLWQEAQQLKAAEGFDCAAEAVGLLEVRLLWAGNEDLTCGVDDIRHHVVAAEALARRAREEAAACIPPPPPAAPDTVVVVQQIEAEPDTIVVVYEPSEELKQAIADVPNVVHFGYNSAEISSESNLIVAQVALVMKNFEEVDVVLFGHTDPRGNPQYNLQLSKRRAEATRVALIQEGIDPRRITVVEMGEAQLRELAEGNREFALNRRVEFQFFGPEGVQIETRRQEMDLQLEEE